MGGWWKEAAPLIGIIGATWLTYFAATRGAKSAEKDLYNSSDPAEGAMRQTRIDIASILLVLGVTNLLLGGILGALVFIASN
jgi:hypothetical protein